LSANAVNVSDVVICNSGSCDENIQEKIEAFSSFPPFYLGKTKEKGE